MNQTPYPFPRSVRVPFGEARRSPRFVVACEPPGKGPEMLAALFIGSGLELATIHDVSAEGVGLLMTRSFAPGVQGVGKLYNASRDFWCSRLLRVTHVEDRQGGGCLVGFRFDKPMNGEQMKRLLDVRTRVEG